VSLPACLALPVAQPGDYKLDDDVWAEVHDSAKDMISHMMVVDPTQRWPARDLLNHKWFQVRGSGSQQPHKLEPSADIVFTTYTHAPTNYGMTSLHT
jgi:serine/threonine protein kinase